MITRFLWLLTIQVVLVISDTILDGSGCAKNEKATHKCPSQTCTEFTCLDIKDEYGDDYQGEEEGSLKCVEAKREEGESCEEKEKKKICHCDDEYLRTEQGGHCVLRADCSLPSTPEPDGCKYEEWSKWSACTVTCGQGVQYRNRTLRVKREENENSCSDTREKKMCDPPPCSSASPGREKEKEKDKEKEKGQGKGKEKDEGKDKEKGKQKDEEKDRGKKKERPVFPKIPKFEIPKQMKRKDTISTHLRHYYDPMKGRNYKMEACFAPEKEGAPIVCEDIPDHFHGYLDKGNRFMIKIKKINYGEPFCSFYKILDTEFSYRDLVFDERYPERRVSFTNLNDIDEEYEDCSKKEVILTPK